MSSILCDNSRCSRLRTSTETCTNCFDVCPSRAVRVDDAIAINNESCTDCGCCAAVCPSEALHWHTKMGFGRILARVERRSKSILGCDTSAAPGTIKAGACLGWLSEEHICALASVAEQGVQIDMTQCDSCRNMHIMNALDERVEAADGNSGLAVKARILLIKDASLLWHDADATGRRQFLSSWRELYEPELSGFPTENPAPLPHGKQVLPGKRKILKWVAKRSGDEVACSIADAYFGRIAINGNCDGCGACVGVCPSGALRQIEDDSPPAIKSSLCVKCGACVAFCTENAIHLPARDPLPI